MANRTGTFTSGKLVGPTGIPAYDYQYSIGTPAPVADPTAPVVAPVAAPVPIPDPSTPGISAAQANIARARLAAAAQATTKAAADAKKAAADAAAAAKTAVTPADQKLSSWKQPVTYKTETLPDGSTKWTSPDGSYVIRKGTTNTSYDATGKVVNTSAGMTPQGLTTLMNTAKQGGNPAASPFSRATMDAALDTTPKTPWDKAAIEAAATASYHPAVVDYGTSQDQFNRNQITRDQNAQAYAKVNGAVDFTHLANGAPSGLDKQGRAPYMNDGSIDPSYQGPAVPGKVGVGNLNTAPEWSAAAMSQMAEGPTSNATQEFKDEGGKPAANPKYIAGYQPWRVGDVPPPTQTPLTPDAAAKLGAQNAAHENAAKALDGYIANLEKALPLAKDAKARAAIQAKLDTYRERKTTYAAEDARNAATIANGTPNPAWSAAPLQGGSGGNPGTLPGGGVQMNSSAAYGPGETPPVEGGWAIPTTAASGTGAGVPPSASATPKTSMAPAIRKANAYLDKLATARAHTSDPAAQKKLDAQIAAWSRRITDYRTR